MTSENLENYGLCSEIVIAAMEAVELDYEFVFRPWSRTLEMTKSGEVLGTFPWYWTEERNELYLFSDPIIEVREMMFYLKDNPKINNFPETATLEELKDYTFGGVLGYYYETTFETNGFNYNLTSNLEGAFKMLQFGRVDFIAEEEAVGWYTIDKILQEDKTIFGALPQKNRSKKMYLIVQKDNEETKAKLDKFNEGLKQIIDNGTYNGI